VKSVRVETLNEKSINRDGRAMSKIRVKRIILWDFVSKVTDVCVYNTAECLETFTHLIRCNG
jgi:hypothetical protein